jgi:1-acyl-sn-glycerol-3-phosphate acyltransferase
MPLFTEDPHDYPHLHNQKELSNMTQEEFMALFEPTHPSLPIRFLRFFLFIVFLGPLKALLVGFCFILFFLVIIIIPHFQFLFKTSRAFKTWAFHVVRPIIRLGLFGLGIIRINLTGSVHPDARTIVCNHLSLIETIIILQQFPVSYLAADWLSRQPLIRQAAKVFDFYFVNRAKHQSGVEHLQEIANDPSMMPVLVFPEGKVTNGEAVLGFRTGAYVSDTLLQPVTIRYRQWLCPKTMSTFTWNDNSWTMYCYQLFSIPFTTVDLDILPPISWKGKKMSPAERAVESQLQIANHLGSLATCRSNRELFAKLDNPMREKLDDKCAKRD